MKVKLSSRQIWVIEIMNRKKCRVGYQIGGHAFFLKVFASHRIQLNTLMSLVRLKLLKYVPKSKNEWRKRGFKIYQLNPNIKGINDIV